MILEIPADLEGLPATSFGQQLLHLGLLLRAVLRIKRSVPVGWPVL